MAPRLKWQLLEVAHSPGKRSRHGLVFDQSRGVAVLHGGMRGVGRARPVNDTWELSAQGWSPVPTRGAVPSPRNRAAMVYDPSIQKTVLFGGQSFNGITWAMRGDTWLFDGVRWRRSRQLFSRTPAPRCGHCMAYDEANGRIVLFGGVVRSQVSMGDTWVFDGRKWHQIVGVGPPPRRYAGLAWDVNLGGCVLYGGCVDDFGEYPLNDCWLFQDNRWQLLPHASGAMYRDDQGICFHHGIGRLVMLPDINNVAGVHALTEAGWEAVEVNGSIPERQCSPAIYDHELGGLLLYGGEVGHDAEQFNDTWLLVAEPE